MTLTRDIDQATAWNPIVGFGRDWVRTVVFVDEAGDPVAVDAAEASSQIARSTPVTITVAQGDAAHKIVLSVGAAALGTERAKESWFVDIGGKRWFAGYFTVTAAAVATPSAVDYTVMVGDSTVLTATVLPGMVDNQTAAEVPFAPSGTIAATDTQSAIVEVSGDVTTEATARAAGDTALGGASAPIVTRRTLGNITIASTSGAWVPLEPFGGSDQLDIVFPGVVAGQRVKLAIDCLSNTGAGNVAMDYFSIVAGAKVNQLGTAAGGIPSWWQSPGFYGQASGAVPYTLQAGDIENGNARFRPHYLAGAAKVIYASSASYVLTCWGDGPFGVRPGTTVVFAGQSLNNNPYAAPWVHPLMAGRPQPWSKIAVNGQSWTALATIDNLDPFGWTERTVGIFFGGQSDLVVPGESDDGPTVYADLLAYVALCEAAGCDLTMFATIPSWVDIDPSAEIARLAYNDLIRTGGDCDGYVDLAAVPEFADPSDTTYFVDGMHLTTAGAAAAAVAGGPVLDSVLAL